MANDDESAPAVWDPTARGGAGGWVRRGDARTHQLRKPAAEGGPQPTVTGQETQGGEGTPPGGRPYLPTSFEAPAAPPPPAEPPTAAYGPAPGAVPGYGYPPAPPAGPPTTAYQPGPPGPPEVPGYGYPPQPPAEPAPPAPGAMPGYGYPYPPAPGYGYPPPPVPGPVPGAQRRGGRTALLVVLVVLLAAGLGGGLVWALSGGKPGTTATPPSTAAPGGDATAAPPPPSEPDAPQSSGAASDSPSADQDAAGRQAKALDDLLTRNSGARQQVGNAVATVQSCPDSASMRSAAKVFEQAATQREQLIGELDSLDLGALDGGQDAAQLLRTAWQQSADADRAYGRWADAVIADGCPDGTAPRTSDREQGDAISGRASKSKQSFVIRWNPIANRYGLASRTGDGI